MDPAGDAGDGRSPGGRTAVAVGALAVVASVTLGPASASADRPTSGDLSVFSGRTVGIGQTVLAGGVGWPGIWAQALFAPSSTFNIAARGDVLYGSPIMGVGTGVGGALSAPMRLHVLGEGNLDVALTARPIAVLGEGATVGQEGIFADDFGWGLGAETGVALGLQVSEVVTLALGTGAGLYYVSLPDADADDVVGTLLLHGGVEALMARDTMLFARIVGGYGFAPEGAFDGHGVIRLSLGLAYLL